MGKDGWEEVRERIRGDSLPAALCGAKLAGPLPLIKGDSCGGGGSGSLTGMPIWRFGEHGAVPRAVIRKALSLETVRVRFFPAERSRSRVELRRAKA